MLTLIVSVIVALLAGSGGTFAGYKWGRAVEAKVRAAVEAVKSAR